jgi:hypothetical protein
MNLRIIQKWLTAAAENSSQLFSRKPWLKNDASGRSSGSTPFPAFPLAQWLVEEMVPPGRDGLYSYGDSAGMEPDFPFNESRSHDFQP